MCGSMVDLQSPTAEIRRGKKRKKKKKQDENIMVCPITYGDHKKLKPGVVASYDIWPRNTEGLFWFQHFINLSFTYLLRDLTKLLTVPDPHGTSVEAACLMTLNLQHTRISTKSTNASNTITTICQTKPVLAIMSMTSGDKMDCISSNKKPKA